MKDHIMADPPEIAELAKQVTWNKSKKVPTTQQAQQFDLASDAEMTEDESVGHETRGSLKQPEAKSEDKKGQIVVPVGERKPAPWQLAVSAYVDLVNVMNQLLNT
jgi:hypothetical protein